jgi:hypothetical protein
MAHSQKPDFVFQRNGRVHLNRPVGASVQSTAGSRGVRISVSNAGYTVFWGSVKGTGYPLHSPVSPFTSPPVRHLVPSRFSWSLTSNISSPCHISNYCRIKYFRRNVYMFPWRRIVSDFTGVFEWRIKYNRQRRDQSCTQFKNMSWRRNKDIYCHSCFISKLRSFAMLLLLNVGNLTLHCCNGLVWHKVRMNFREDNLLV